MRTIYLILPAASIAVFARYRLPWLRRTIVGAWVSGSLLAAAVGSAYVIGVGGHIGVPQVLLAIYLGCAMMLLLRLIDGAIKSGLAVILLKSNAKRSTWRIISAALLRVLVLAAIALPWVMSGVMVYRPRIQPSETPQTVLDIAFEPVNFPSRDGTPIAGWFVSGESSTTVILCHGLGATKSGMWTMLRTLHIARVNVLAIDFRAHGFSGGQLCTFGEKESDDVRGAVDWLKSTHPEHADRIVTVGASLGGAASIIAASDDPRIDAVAVLGTFDSLPELTNDISKQQMPIGISWLTRHFGLPMASLHCGVDLMRVKPADAIEKIWPRPVLIVHGANDEIIPTARGQKLYDAAYFPRELLITNDSHNSLMENPGVISRVLEFVVGSKPQPVI